jgi:hypothetical protein
MPIGCWRPSIGRSASGASAYAWRGRGVIRRLDDQTVADLVQALWVVSETWLAFAEMDGGDADAQHGLRLLRVVLQPYLT